MRTYKRINIIKNKLITRELPGKGHISVKINDYVTPPDILGEVKQAAGFRIINVALQLEIKPEKASNYIIRKVGEHIYRGEILAEKHLLFTKETKKVYAIIDGVIEHIDPLNGQVLIKIIKKQENIPAGLWGKIVSIEEDNKIVIESQVIEIKCKAARGYPREGSIKVISSNHETVQEHMVKDDYAGKVLVGGSLISRHALSKAVNNRVSGVIGGSINFEDIQTVGETSDIGTTFMVTEGYGPIAMNSDIYAIFQKYDNYYCFIDGKAQTLTIPLENVDALQEPKNNSELEIGTTVRVCGDENIGVVGIIDEIIEAHTFNSGFRTSAFKISSGPKEYIIAQTNVEILQ
ncbi:MAG: hypothetical protein M3P33_04125 [bacterium]|nr:hypothetical protein [bacterium]